MISVALVLSPIYDVDIVQKARTKQAESNLWYMHMFDHLMYKVLVRYMLCVSEFKSIPAIICDAKYGVVYFELAYLFFFMILRIFVLDLIIIIKSEIWIMNHCLGLVCRTLV